MRMTREEFGAAYECGGYQGTIRFLQKSGVDQDLANEVAQAAWACPHRCKKRAARVQAPRAANRGSVSRRIFLPRTRNAIGQIARRNSCRDVSRTTGVEGTHASDPLSGSTWRK